MKYKNFDDYKNIKTTKTEYVRVGSQWKKVGSKKYLSSMKNHKYHTSENTLKFFRGLGGFERNQYSYTKRGYIPVRNISISPDRRTKIVTDFHFDKSDKLYNRSYLNYSKQFNRKR